MSGESIEVRGRTTEEAIRAALTRLGVAREDVDVEVLSEGRLGVFGVGSQEARVRVTVIGDDEEEEFEDIEIPRRTEDEMAALQDEEDEEDYDEDEEAQESTQAQPAPRQARVEEDDEEEEEEEEEDEDEEEPVLVGDDDAELARETLERMLDLLDFPNIVTVRGLQRERGKATILLDVAGDDVGLLIGRHGETLSSLQFVLNACLGKQMPRETRIVIDVEHYRERREQALKGIALRAADRARRERHPVSLQPMPPNERRIIHLTLQTSRWVTTESEGEGLERRVVVTPKPGSAAPPPRRPSYGGGYQRGYRG
jgi:spoIIIJ-associated protein